MNLYRKVLLGPIASPVLSNDGKKRTKIEKCNNEMLSKEGK